MTDVTGNEKLSATAKLVRKHARGRDVPDWSRALVDKDELARLLEHAMHEEGVFYNRLNFFLVFETVLLGSVITTYANTRVPIQFLVLMPGVGLLVTLLWLYAQYNKLQFVKVLEARLEDHLPEFRETIEIIRFTRRFNRSATSFLTFVWPVLFVVAWLVVAWSFAAPISRPTVGATKPQRSDVNLHSPQPAAGSQAGVAKARR